MCGESSSKKIADTKCSRFSGLSFHSTLKVFISFNITKKTSYSLKLNMLKYEDNNSILRNLDNNYMFIIKKTI